MPGFSQKVKRLLRLPSKKLPPESKIALRAAEASALPEPKRHTHSVSVTNEYHVHSDGTVRVRMVIEYVLEPGATLQEGFKSILSRASSPARSVSELEICDAEGRSLQFKETIDRDGWQRVNFKFAALADGDLASSHFVTLSYTIHGGIHQDNRGWQRFDVDWTSRWRIPVKSSTYRLTFENPASVCADSVHLVAWKNKRRSFASALKSHGRGFEYCTAENLHNIEFEWRDA